MRNPLRKRLPREIRGQWKKYLVLFLLLTLTIGFVSGLFVANDSMEHAARESYTKYNIEDGHFTLKDEPTDELLKTFSDEGINIVKQFYKDFDEDSDLDGSKDARIRVFVMRDEMNRSCLMEGDFPQKDDEIVIDRMHADNSDIWVGDTVALNGRKMLITGVVAFSDYSTLYENSSDVMFDALTFDVGAVTAECYEKLDGRESYQYAFQYDPRPVDETDQKNKAEDLAVKLAVLAATGGMLDDEDKAEELSDLIDEADALKEQGDALEAEGDILKAEGDDLEAQGDLLKEKGDTLETEGDVLKKDAEILTGKIMTMLKAAGVPVDPSAMSGDSDGELPQEIIAMLPEELRGELKDIQSRRDDLTAKADDLKAEGDELQKKADDLQARADELEARGDKLQDEADALEAKLPEIIPGVTKFEDLEKYEDHTNELTDFVPEFANQAIHFAPSDLGSDKRLGEILLMILVIVLAFIFAITVNNTIVNEAAVIGTLRASGFTRFELLRHYISIPIFATFLAAMAGNALGYTFFKNVVVAMYYNSYSLPTYVTLWNADGFVKTTVLPLIIMIAVCTVVVYLKLRIDPLKFLRRDLSLTHRKRALKLPRWKFMTRFRLRILFRNIPDYLVLFGGIFFVMVMLSFSIGMPATLDNYKADITDYMIADYQYILKSCQDGDGETILTDESTAERFSVTGLETVDGVHVGEDINVYGYVKDSRFIDLPDDADGVYISQAYSDKFGLNAGDSITLKEKYGEKEYSFDIEGIYDLPGTLSVFMPVEDYNSVFDVKDDEFTGYLTENEITDIEDKQIMSVVTRDDMLKLARQLDHSMGAYTTYFSIACLLMAILLIYLLTKLIIEKNATSISMVKVLGYENKEISSLYVRLTSVVVVIAAIATTYISFRVVDNVWKGYMYSMNGWFVFYMGIDGFIKSVLIVVVAYTVVALIDMRRIRRIPLTEALKNVE